MDCNLFKYRINSTVPNIWYTVTQFDAQNSKHQVKVWAFNDLPYADLI